MQQIYPRHNKKTPNPNDENKSQIPCHTTHNPFIRSLTAPPISNKQIKHKNSKLKQQKTKGWENTAIANKQKLNEVIVISTSSCRWCSHRFPVSLNEIWFPFCDQEEKGTDTQTMTQWNQTIRLKRSNTEKRKERKITLTKLRKSSATSNGEREEREKAKWKQILWFRAEIGRLGPIDCAETRVCEKRFFF